MVHLHPCSLARCSCRLDLSLGIKPDWHHQQRDPEGSGYTGLGKSLARHRKNGLLMKELKRIVYAQEVLVVSQMVCISSLEWF